MTSHQTTLALELSISPERRLAYSVMAQRIREAMSVGGVMASQTASETGYRVEPAIDDPNERVVVTWYDRGADDENALARARQREALERILWLVVDEVEDINGAHLQAWGDPCVVIKLCGLRPGRRRAGVTFWSRFRGGHRALLDPSFGRSGTF